MGAWWPPRGDRVAGAWWARGGHVMGAWRARGGRVDWGDLRSHPHAQRATLKGPRHTELCTGGHRVTMGTVGTCTASTNSSAACWRSLRVCSASASSSSADALRAKQRATQRARRGQVGQGPRAGHGSGSVRSSVSGASVPSGHQLSGAPVVLESHQAIS
eukprot:872628-Prymnesium_polylepis.1